jgi:hypothetical protein
MKQADNMVDIGAVWYSWRQSDTIKTSSDQETTPYGRDQEIDENCSTHPAQRPLANVDVKILFNRYQKNCTAIINNVTYFLRI